MQFVIDFLKSSKNFITIKIYKFEIKNVSTVPTNAAIIKMPTNNLIKQAFFTMKKVRKKRDVAFRHFPRSFCPLL